MAPMKVMTPHKDQIISERPAEPDDWRTPLGLMKIPEPTIEPIIIATPSSKPNRRSIATSSVVPRAAAPAVIGSFSAAKTSSFGDTMTVTLITHNSVDRTESPWIFTHFTAH